MKRAAAAFISVIIAVLIVCGCEPAAASCASPCADRVKARILEQHYQQVWRSAPPATRTHLRRIAACESDGNHRALSSDGRFRGLLQFNLTTWQTVGGTGDPAAATRWEQWARGVLLYRSRGPQPWPVCRYR